MTYTIQLKYAILNMILHKYTNYIFYTRSAKVVKNCSNKKMCWKSKNWINLKQKLLFIYSDLKKKKKEEQLMWLNSSHGTIFLYSDTFKVESIIYFQNKHYDQTTINIQIVLYKGLLFKTVLE